MNALSRFQQLSKLPGTIYREQPGRKTFAAKVNGEAVFVKLHYGVGWSEILKNWLQCKAPILGAKDEYLALTKLHQLKVNTLEVLEFGETGFNPATRNSYLVTRALQNTTSLETLCESWPEKPPGIRFKRQLIAEVARVAATLHAHGINHRDFYICHFLLDEKHYQITHQIKLYLIDLHRAQLRHKTPWRWQVKDIAGLYFSALRIGLTRRDFFYFMQCYQKALGIVNFPFEKFWFEMENRAWRLYEKTYFQRQRRLGKYIWFDASMDANLRQQLFNDPDQLMNKGQCLKDDNTTTVVKYCHGEKTFIIKRYNARTFKTWCKRFFKMSRARRCWLQSMRLQQLGLHTPQSSAMLALAWVNRSYLVTEYLTGKDLVQQLTVAQPNVEYWAQQVRQLFAALAAIYTAHGDMKATNLWCYQQQLYLLDLDGMRRYQTQTALQKALSKDRGRFLKNWQPHAELLKIFKKVIGFKS